MKEPTPNDPIFRDDDSDCEGNPPVTWGDVQKEEEGQEKEEERLRGASYRHHRQSLA